MALINIIPDMTSAATPSGVASASTTSGTRYPFKTMDRDLATYWLATIPTGWIQYKIDVGKTCTAYSMTASDIYFDYMPKNFSLQASNTGEFAGEEITLDTQSGIIWVGGEKKTFYFTNTNSYLYYRIDITLINSSSYGVIINEIELLALITPISSLIVSAILTAQMQTNSTLLLASATITAKNKAINKSSVTVEAMILSEAQRATNVYSFIFVGEIQRSYTTQTFNFVQEIEQLQSSTIITRVNA